MFALSSDSRFREENRLSVASVSSFRVSACCRLVAHHCQATNRSQNVATYSPIVYWGMRLAG